MRDVAAPEAPPSTFTEFNVRQDKGKPHYIRLHDSVVKRLERELGGNPGSTGLLLGSIENGDSLHHRSGAIRAHADGGGPYPCVEIE
jgi:hypothetical protein